MKTEHSLVEIKDNEIQCNSSASECAIKDLDLAHSCSLMRRRCPLVNGAEHKIRDVIISVVGVVLAIGIYAGSFHLLAQIVIDSFGSKCSLSDSLIIMRSIFILLFIYYGYSMQRLK